MRKELNESKSQVLLVEYKRETDIQEQSQKAQEEIISLQHLVQGKMLQKFELHLMKFLLIFFLTICEQNFLCWRISLIWSFLKASEFIRNFF